MSRVWAAGPSRAGAEPSQSESVRERHEAGQRACGAGELAQVTVNERGAERSEKGQSVNGWAEAGPSRC